MQWIDKETVPIPIDTEVLAVWKGRVGILYIDSEENKNYFAYDPCQMDKIACFDDEAFRRINYWMHLPAAEFKINKLLWNHILDKQPENGEMIIHLDRLYENEGFQSRPMGMRKYEMHCSFEELLKSNKEQGWPIPDFWWIYAKDFPFPKATQECNKSEI